jgi:hypothetical protein
MNALLTTAQMTTSLDEVKARLRATWMSGDYDLFSRYMETGAERFYRRLGVKPGTRLLESAAATVNSP